MSVIEMSLLDWEEDEAWKWSRCLLTWEEIGECSVVQCVFE